MANASELGNDRPGSVPDPDLSIELVDVAGWTGLNESLTSLLELTPLSPRQVKDFRQAVVEMAGNALEWGRAEGQKPWALVTCRIGPEDVTAVVSDRGLGFDHSGPPSLDDPRTRRRGGFGIMLAKGLVDVLSYNERGNEVTLILRFKPESSQAS